MARNSQFSSAQRRSAVERAFVKGERPIDVARDLAIHPTTLYRWAADSSTRGAVEPARIRLIDATQQLLKTSDYSEITMDDVAQLCGVSLRTAFHHFDSKRTLFRASVDDAAAELISELDARSRIAEWPADSVGQLRLFLQLAGESIYSTPKTHVLFRDSGVPPSDGSAERWHSAFVDAVASLISAGIDSAAISRSVDAKQSARIITGAMRGIHATVFDGAHASVALSHISRLHETLILTR